MIKIFGIWILSFGFYLNPSKAETNLKRNKMFGLKGKINKANKILKTAKKEIEKISDNIDTKDRKRFDACCRNLETAVHKENLSDIKKYSNDLLDITRDIQHSNKSVLREYAEAIIIALILALAIRTYVVQAFKIPSGSMLNTLQIGDHILVNKFIYWFTDPKRQDVIVFRYPVDETRDFIKRVMAIGGDTIRSKNKNIFLNHKKINEPYVIHKDSFIFKKDSGSVFGDEGLRDNFGPIKVPEGSYFVMGDNRDRSLDSRFWKFVDREKIKGKAFMIYWSWFENGSLMNKVRWERIGSLIH